MIQVTTCLFLISPLPLTKCSVLYHSITPDVEQTYKRTITPVNLCISLPALFLYLNFEHSFIPFLFFLYSSHFISSLFSSNLIPFKSVSHFIQTYRTSTTHKNFLPYLLSYILSTSLPGTKKKMATNSSRGNPSTFIVPLTPFFL